ncbi:hypothetical protein O6H91_08G039300 [Diphasiastrum complanatum]|uniref:Uncharacterized protein n=1 Tax=Diphasiastrum complanatum TaxID=34168 RepID=A0ACC2CWZ3_DIPCM|nr:hypothetical protein O6H91_08G039300 [Diphasiastrum complanatum]
MMCVCVCVCVVGKMDKAKKAYADLGLTSDASIADVKAAYRRLALTCHPDMNCTDSTEFVRITAAYEGIMKKNMNKNLENVDVWHRHTYNHPPQFGYKNQAVAVWGVGLAMGCMLFGSLLLWGRSHVHESYHRRGPFRAVEPTPDAQKRQRIAALLLEKARAERQ